jgi:hypothetical protein
LAFAGGVAATAVTFFLLTLGSGFGLLLINPTTHAGPTLPTFLTGGAIYFVAAQAFGFATGGHLAGRLLGPLAESSAQEEFRAEAHGFMAWAVAVVATLAIVTIVGLSAASTSATTAAMYGALATKNDATPSAYLVDILFRPARPTGHTLGDISSRTEAARIVDVGLAAGVQPAAADRTRLIGLVAAQVGISEADAANRVDALQSAQKAHIEAQANYVRKAASYAALWLALSLVFGAIVSITAAIEARHEDDRQSV